MTLVTSRPAIMSSKIILDPLPSPTSDNASAGPRYRPFASSNHHVTKGRYITSNDPRGYIPVYEYPLNGQWIMLDMDDGYVLWTGIWKALGNSKADIVKMIESQPDLAPRLRRVRGGYLKIQGTWMPYEVALKLARIVAWPIRYELIPLFGPTFPDLCLSPDQPGYGQIVKPGTTKRRRRQVPPANTSGSLPNSQHDWQHSSAPHHSLTSNLHGSRNPPSAYHAPYGLEGHQYPMSSAYSSRRYSMSDDTQDDSTDSITLHNPYGEQSTNTTTNSLWRPGTASTSVSSSDVSPVYPGSGSASSPSVSIRYSPYPNPPQQTRPRGSSHSSLASTISGTLPSASLPSSKSLFHPFLEPEKIFIPPINAPSSAVRSHASHATLLERESSRTWSGTSTDNSGKGKLTLPPISALLNERRRSGFCDDSIAVLKRLRSSSDDVILPESHSTSGVGSSSGHANELSNPRRLSAPTVSQAAESIERRFGPQSAPSAYAGFRGNLPPLSSSTGVSRNPPSVSTTAPSPTSSLSSHSYSHSIDDRSPSRTSAASPIRRPESQSSSSIDDIRGRLYESQLEERHEPRLTGSSVFHDHDQSRPRVARYEHHGPAGQPSQLDGNERHVDSTRQSWRPW